MTRANTGKRSPLKVVTTILAVIVVILFVAAGVRINDHAKSYSWEIDARDYIYSAENGRYDNLLDTAIHDMNKDAKYSAEVAEYRALAFYYEHAVLEHAYRTTGNNEKADEHVKRMEEYEAQLGSLSSRAEAAREAARTAEHTKSEG